MIKPKRYLCGVTLTDEEMAHWKNPDEKEVLGIDIDIAILESLERIEKHLGIEKEKQE